MMKKLFFSVFLLLMMAIGAMAQETLTVYDGTVTSGYVPMYVGYFDDFTRSQYVIPAEDLTDMENGQITSIRYYTSLTSPYTTASTVDFYITEVNNTSVSAFVDKASATMIYQGTLDFVLVGDKCELTITFGTPYTYNGGNLLIGCENTTDAGYQFVYFYGQTVNNASISGYNSSSLANVTPTQRNFIPKTTFTYTPVAASCPRVNNLSANNLTSSSADITWEAGGSETAWVLKYGPAGFNVETEGTTQNISTTPAFEITGLSANTAYDVYVKAVCGGGDESTWRKVSFRTACGAIASFPWSEDFENFSASSSGVKLEEPCWVNEHISGSGSYFFEVYSGTNGSNNTKQLRLHDMSNGTMTKLMLPEFNFGGVAHQFVLDVYRNATGSSYTSEGIRIYASADGEIEGATELGFVYRNYTQTDGNVVPVESATGWYTYEFNIPITGTCYIILRGESQYGSATYMDNFIVREAPTCIKPTAFTVSNITGHTATLTWAAGADETAWQISLNDDEDDLINVTEPTYTLTGLAPESDYTVKVRAKCSESDYSEWTANVAFTTTVSCPAPADFTVAALAATSATLTWAAGEAGEWVLQYGTDNTFAENTEITVDAASAELTGLTAETVYYARVKAVCGVDDESAWSSTLSFEPTAKITIGSGTATSNYLPTYNYFNYELTQQIYTAAEIGAAGTISSVDFYNAGSTKTRTLNVYLVNTDKNTFADGSDWIAVADGDLVFSGSVTFTSGRWTTITFDNDFYYDGTSNVAIVVDDNTGDYTNSPHISCRVFAAASQAIYYNNDSNNPDPTSPSAAGTLSNNKNQIRLMLTPGAPSTCTKPSSLEISNITETGATLTWLAGADETAWQICVNGDEDNLIDVDAPTYALTGLSAASTYTVKLRSNCGNGDFSIWTADIEFNTAICAAEDQCQLTFTLTDGYGDGWNGAAIQVTDVVTGIVIGELSGENLDGIDDDYEETNTFTLAVCNDREIRFSWISGEYDDECSYTVTDVNGVEIFSGSDEMTSPVTYTVSCSAPVTTYTITATAGENGTITPAGAVTVDEGADQAFTITPAAGYQIASVMVDTDNDVTDELEYNDGVYTYTFENVVANHTIHATFELLQTYTITVNITGNGEVVATDEDDNVYPMENGVVTVNNGADVYLEITPAENYQIESVTIDGVPEELEQEDLAGYSYSFFVVEQNHIIDVTFVPADAVDMIDAASMAIYPNPNNGMFSIDFSNIEGDATYEIIDVRGAVVETRSINVMNGATMNFNHNLDAGTYFVRIISGDKVYVEQIVVE